VGPTSKTFLDTIFEVFSVLKKRNPFLKMVAKWYASVLLVKGNSCAHNVLSLSSFACVRP
jgi:hypothetical protein